MTLSFDISMVFTSRNFRDLLQLVLRFHIFVQPKIAICYAKKKCLLHILNVHFEFFDEFEIIKSLKILFFHCESVDAF